MPRAGNLEISDCSLVQRSAVVRARVVQGIEFTLLHDEGITHVNALGILNEDHEPGSRAYGIPHPGIFLISPDGIIRYKFAEEGYRTRPDFSNVLEAAAQM